MATTKKIYDALTYCKKMVKEMPLEDVFPFIAQDVSDLIWMASPWYWTLGLLPPVALASNTSDYTVALPADFLMVQTCWLVSTSSKESPREVMPVSIIPASSAGIVGQPSLLYVFGEPDDDGTLRVFPKPGTISGETITLYPVYKKVAPIVNTADVYLDTLSQEDEWFGVFREGCLWKAFLYADDARAGGVSVASNGSIQYSGQRGVFQEALITMTQRERVLLLNTRDLLDQKI